MIVSTRMCIFASACTAIMLRSLVYFVCLCKISINCANSVGLNEVFSGIYNPQCNPSLELFGGAWLMSAERLTKHPKMRSWIDSIRFIEDHTFMVVMGGRVSPEECAKSTEQVIMSRDYFDFFVEHLSSTLNIGESSDVHPLLLNRTVRKAIHLKSVALQPTPADKRNPFLLNTIAVIPFATVSGLSHDSTTSVTRLMRQAFFEATFWSIYSNFRSIAVSVTNDDDLRSLMDLKLPLFYVLKRFDKSLVEKVANVKQTVEMAFNQLRTNSSWSHFKYVYFTEGDEILHMRSHEALSAAMSSSTEGVEKQFVLIPHRMQVVLCCCNALILVLKTIIHVMLSDDAHPSEPAPKQRNSAPLEARCVRAFYVFAYVCRVVHLTMYLCGVSSGFATSL
jgi:hypothetical protein